MGIFSGSVGVIFGVQNHWSVIRHTDMFSCQFVKALQIPQSNRLKSRQSSFVSVFCISYSAVLLWLLSKHTKKAAYNGVCCVLAAWWLNRLSLLLSCVKTQFLMRFSSFNFQVVGHAQSRFFVVFPCVEVIRDYILQNFK